MQEHVYQIFARNRTVAVYLYLDLDPKRGERYATSGSYEFIGHSPIIPYR